MDYEGLIDDNCVLISLIASSMNYETAVTFTRGHFNKVVFAVYRTKRTIGLYSCHICQCWKLTITKIQLSTMFLYFTLMSSYMCKLCSFVFKSQLFTAAIIPS